MFMNISTKKISSLLVAMVFAASSLTMMGCTKTEKTVAGVVVGGGSGALIGGLAGGPVGAGVGAGVGAVVGGVVGNQIK